MPAVVDDTESNPGTENIYRFSVWIRWDEESGNVNRLAFRAWQGSMWQVPEADLVMLSSNERLFLQCILPDCGDPAAHDQPAAILRTTAVNTRMVRDFNCCVKKRSIWVPH